MLPLPELQLVMAGALCQGPGRVPLAAFRGPIERVLLGFKVHANTISHARLVALEETFPRCRTALGPARFNRLSRNFLEAGGGATLPMAELGRDFPGWLGRRRPDATPAALARLDWAWLEAWRAADATALALPDLTELGEAALLTFPVHRHPAARLVAVGPRACRFAGLAARRRVLITRPAYDVRVIAASPGVTALFAALDAPTTLGSLLTLPTCDPIALLTEGLAAGLISPIES
jgi:hypothetical protein